MSKQSKGRRRFPESTGSDQEDTRGVSSRDKEESEGYGSKSSQSKRTNKKGKGKSMGKRTNRKEREVKSTNDITWYSANPDLLRDSASINFSWPTGNQYLNNQFWTGSENYVNTMPKVPGVASIMLRPVYGNIGWGGQSSPVDPITVASKHNFSYVRADNTGSSPYDSPDMMIYYLAMSSVYSFVAWLRRLYGYMSLYDGRNKYLPKSLIVGNGVDFESMNNNLATFRFWLNTFIKKVSAFAVPSTIYLFYRKAFLYQHLYTEGSSIKSQMYQFVPAGFEQFSIDEMFKGQLEFVPFPEERLMSVDDIISYGENMFAKLWNQQDFGIISGDTLKKYGDNIIKVAPIDVDFTVAPIFDPLVLYQIKNGTWLSSGALDISNLRQDNDGVLYYSINNSSGGVTLNQAIPPVLTIDMPDVPPEVVMEATRLTAAWGDVNYGSACAVGTELIMDIFISTDPSGYPENTVRGFKLQQQVDLYNAVSSASYLPKFIGCHSQFKFLPRMLVTVNNGDLNYVAQIHDIDNYAVVDHVFLAKVHEAALLNMLDVPSVGKAIYK